MKIFFWIIVFFCFGFMVFSLTAGYYFFAMIFHVKNNKIAQKGFDRFKETVNITLSDTNIVDTIIQGRERFASYPLDTLEIKSSDGLLLKAYYWQSEPIETQEKQQAVQKVAVLLHGFRDSGSGLTYLAEEYHKRHYSVLLIDSRAHGQSEGSTAGMGFLEARDLLLWIDELLKKTGDKTEIILHGISMGAATILNYCGLPEVKEKQQNRHIVKIVADSAFTNYSDQVISQMSNVISGRGIQSLVRYGVLWGGSLSCKLSNGFFYHQNNPEKAAAQREKAGLENVPVLLFHGEKDLLVPPAMAKKIYDGLSQEKKLVIVKDAPHIGSYFYDKKGYFAAIEIFE